MQAERRAIATYRGAATRPISRLRVAATTDFGFAPTERVIADMFRTSSRPSVRPSGATRTHPDCSRADEAFRGHARRGLPRAPPRACARNIRTRSGRMSRQCRGRACATPRRTWRARCRCRPSCIAAGRFLRQHDFVLTPAVTISPRPWRELYPAEIDGKPTKSYFHWLALAYAVTLAGHPAVSLPVGLDRDGMPFGLQIVGPRGGDVATLAVAREIEALLGATRRRPGPSRISPGCAVSRRCPAGPVFWISTEAANERDGLPVVLSRSGRATMASSSASSGGGGGGGGGERVLPLRVRGPRPRLPSFPP